MREIQVHPPSKRKPVEVVRRLQFSANGAELLALVGPDQRTRDGRVGFTSRFHLYDFATDAGRQLFPGWRFGDGAGSYVLTADPPISPDCKLLAFEEDTGEEESDVLFEELAESGFESGSFPHLRGCPHGLGGLVFTPDGSELLAVRNFYEGTSGLGGHWAPDVVRLETASLKKPPVRYEEKVNPLTGATRRKPIYDVHWSPGLALPHGTAAIAALSTDGRLLAVGGVAADVHVVDLERKKAVALFPWEGRFLRDGHPVRLGFDPVARWVVMLTNGRLFARPLGAGKAWQTKSTLGYAHDFAFHPDGRVLCAVFADGQARYLDPHTGAVRQSFEWVKKPKPLYSVAFSPDGLICAAGGENGKVVIWDVD
jgi:hypothetical protein